MAISKARPNTSISRVRKSVLQFVVHRKMEIAATMAHFSKMNKTNNFGLMLNNSKSAFKSSLK